MGQTRKLPHRDANGQLKRDPKYQDRPIFSRNSVQQEIPDTLLEAVFTIQLHFERWRRREL